MSASIGEHMRCPEGTLIQGRYRVVKEVGCGNFAKVYKCEDTRQPGAEPVAVKILKKEYATDAAFELEILKALRAKAHGRKIVTMLDHFNVSAYPCFVFKLAGPSLRSRKMGVSRQAVTIHDVRRLAQDIISTLAFLHTELRMIHTDLKPENILLESPDNEEGLGSSFTIADFGSASFYRPERPDSDLISTRPYRAPEVVLGMPWTPKADVWSLACILFEVYYGGRLFEVHDDHEHLNKFEQRLGKIPAAFARPSKLFRRFFDDAGNINRRPTTPVSRTIGEILRGEAEFMDLIRQMLMFDPNQRISCEAALNHPFMLRGPSSRSTSSAIPAPMPVAVAPTARDAAAPLQPTAAPNSKAMIAQRAVATDKENSAAAAAGAAAGECIPGTSIPLPPSSYNTLAEQAKGKWQRPAAGVPSARIGAPAPVVNAPMSRKLF